jgi:hypothetical protein
MLGPKVSGQPKGIQLLVSLKLVSLEMSPAYTILDIPKIDKTKPTRIELKNIDFN